MIKAHTLALAAGALLVLRMAAAQPPGAGAPPQAGQPSVFFMTNAAPVMPFGGAVDILAGEGHVTGQVVTGKPYTADSITESTQTLADGNRITHRNDARIDRDAQGRTRRAQTLNDLGAWQTANEPVTMITINDPVAGVSYFLDPVARTARQLRPLTIATNSRLTWEAAVPGIPVPPPAVGVGDVTVMVRGVNAGEAPAGTEALESGSIEVVAEDFIGVTPSAAAGGRIFAPAMAARPLPFVAPGSRVDEDLGEQVLEGMLVRGHRQTQTIPAGALGNERPIEIVAEEWYAADIEAVVLRRNYDPRFGETVYRLVNVVRAEPSPDLFLVPQGYELQDDAAKQTGLRGFAPPPAGAQPTIERRVFLIRPEPATSAQE
jgi:hypothetical protein